MSYPIEVNLIPGLPRRLFEHGASTYEGVVMHSTAVYEDSAEAERTYEVTH